MRKQFLVLSLSLFSFSLLYAQGPDCNLAEVVCSDADITFNSTGPGINDFQNSNNDAGCLEDNEHQSSWYYFEFSNDMPPGSLIEFTINPDGGQNEDYDFAIYGPSGPNDPQVDCNDLGSPLRCSYAPPGCFFCPQTGLGNGTSDTEEDGGLNSDGFVAALPVYPGQGYYLLIDNFAMTAIGFELEWGGAAAGFLNCTVDPTCNLTVSINDDLEVCPGGSSVLIDVTVSGNTEEVTYVWTADNGAILGFLDDVNAATPMLTVPDGFNGTLTYNLAATESGNCTENVSITIDVGSPPPPTITGEPLCSGSEALLDAGPGFTSYTWSTGENTQTISVDATGTYTVTITEGTSCTAEGSFTVVAGENPTVSLDNSVYERCAGETVTVNVTGGNFASLTWPDGSNGNSWSTADVGNFGVEATSTEGCILNFPFVINELTTPEVEIAEQFGITCLSSGLNLEVVFLNGNSNNVRYFWTGPDITIANSGDANPFVTIPGDYTVQVTDNTTGCVSEVATTTVEENINPPDATISQSNQLDCANPTTTLTIPDPPSGQTYSVEWILNGMVVSTDLNFITEQEGNYSLNVIGDQTGCTNSSSYLLEEINDEPTAIDLNIIPEACRGGDDAIIEILGVTGGIGPFTYSFNEAPASTQNSYDNLAPGDYQIEAFDSRGCSVIERVTVIASDNILEVNLPEFQTIQLGDDLTLQAQLQSSGQTINSIAWISDQGLTCPDCDLIWEVGLLTNGANFQVTVIDEVGCAVTDSTRVVVEKDYGVYIPNVFSPNGDGSNDRFTIFGDNEVDRITRFAIYDRWGGSVFDEADLPINDLTIGWDGRVRGEAAPTGVYVYMIEVTFIDGRTISYEGGVTLLR